MKRQFITGNYSKLLLLLIIILANVNIVTPYDFLLAVPHYRVKWSGIESCGQVFHFWGAATVLLHCKLSSEEHAKSLLPGAYVSTTGDRDIVANCNHN